LRLLAVLSTVAIHASLVALLEVEEYSLLHGVVAAYSSLAAEAEGLWLSFATLATARSQLPEAAEALAGHPWRLLPHWLRICLPLQRACSQLTSELLAFHSFFGGLVWRALCAYLMNSFGPVQRFSRGRVRLVALLSPKRSFAGA
jgi:hypothetical protein